MLKTTTNVISMNFFTEGKSCLNQGKKVQNSTTLGASIEILNNFVFYVFNLGKFPSE
jgi:hypothetical protein